MVKRARIRARSLASELDRILSVVASAGSGKNLLRSHRRSCRFARRRTPRDICRML